MIQILYQHPLSGQAWDITTTISSATWETKRRGSPASLSVKQVSPGPVQWAEGGTLIFKKDGAGVFLGYVFDIEQDETDRVTVKAYDQMRYLKNKDTYVFEGQRADQVIQQIAADFGLTLGPIANTGYVIPSMVEDIQTLLDIMLKALDLTIINTGKMYVLWDDFGKLTLSDADALKLGLMIGDASLATGYKDRSEIDSATANQIKLVRDNKKSGKRDVYLIQDSDSIRTWGILMHQEKVNENLNSAQIDSLGQSMLELKNRPSRTFTVNALTSDVSVRAGRSIFIRIADLGVSAFHLIEEASHDLVNEKMTLKLKV